MRSAAESDEVGCPDPAAVEHRMLSARSCRASERYRSRRVAASLTVATVTRYRRNSLRNEYPRSHHGVTAWRSGSTAWAGWAATWSRGWYAGGIPSSREIAAQG